ncbi:ArdC-like ssDNA-binding domain-containing protein [Microbacterium azadirachtae]|uniref:ArdC-like ssDNA-binding domain-containing protein n=1 Tax=Microbacterium azadirachtae TaxID=582680 RepID=UPI00088DA43D|nr:ArdC-like ssDNA-binding domain-containing protein [Microbacterium azadirachtae]SDL93152.1 Antirestriction protein ArdC [Microbacterium azadirachtae]SEG14752.1 Antirestriction protein ArdC [Microbacterium azadirachtae]SEG17301.1 Antirestriction protein ArdC [Microbacterium azadirachtae]
MNKKSTTNSAEERKAHAEALHAAIIEQVQQLTESGQWQRFLDFARSFHQYSLNNVLLILAQRPDATMVAGYRQWQNKGRQVRKGETGIRIFGHSTKNLPNAEDDPSEDQRAVHYFPVLTVFDIAQTEAIDGAPAIPTDPVQKLTGDNDRGILTPLAEHLRRAGWMIAREHLWQANGYTDPARHLIVIDHNLSPAQTAKTLLHEAAHIQLDHTADLKEYRTHRGRMEVEAESVAYILAGLAGLDTSTYSIGYITGWSAADPDLVRETANHVLEAVHAIHPALASDESLEK